MCHFPRQAKALVHAICSESDRLSRMHDVLFDATANPSPEEVLLFANILCKSVDCKKLFSYGEANEYERLAFRLRATADDAKGKSGQDSAAAAVFDQVSKLAQRCLDILQLRNHTQPLLDSAEPAHAAGLDALAQGKSPLLARKLVLLHCQKHFS